MIGVVAEENRRVADARFDAARNPPTGETRASTGPRKPPAIRATIGPRKPTATTRHSAVISDVAAAVAGGLGGAATAKSGSGAANARKAPLTPPPPEPP